MAKNTFQFLSTQKSDFIYPPELLYLHLIRDIFAEFSKFDTRGLSLTPGLFFKL